tara:strand:- start:267 stop:881 length:615 start_codon:yes stop_codon:yes gene_type:complete
MENNFIILLVIIVVSAVLSASFVIFLIKREILDVSDEIDVSKRDIEKNLDLINQNVNNINNLLNTYKRVIDEKNIELKKFKEGTEILKQKGLYISLIDILEFIKQFISDSKNLDTKTQNYIKAIYDKLDIILTNSGIEMFEPELNQNLMEVEGCSPIRETTKTKDNNKVNLISSIIKPGYRLQISENDFIILKNSEVKVFELEN